MHPRVKQQNYFIFIFLNKYFQIRMGNILTFMTHKSNSSFNEKKKSILFFLIQIAKQNEKYKMKNTKFVS